ncbi:MAG: hypothetical protein ACTHOE_14500 [Conexibacter sp.]
MRSVKLSLTAMVAVVALAALVSVASARTLSYSSQTWRTTFPNVEYTGAFNAVRCALTLEGTLHSRNVAKTAGALIGYVTRASHAAACGAGSAIVLAETLPWHLRYRSFTGTLPNITSVGLDIVEYAVSLREALGIFCSIRSNATEPVTLTLSREGGGALTSARIGGTLPSSCGFNITLAGTSNTLTVLNSTTAITVTLI